MAISQATLNDTALSPIGVRHVAGSLLVLIAQAFIVFSPVVLLD